MQEYIKKQYVAKKILEPIIKDTPQTRKSGIYLWERTDECNITFFYCGQARDIYQRSLGHIMGYQRLDLSLRKRKFKSKDNPYGWTFKILEYCPSDKLDEREKYWILENLKQGKQTYNLNYGGNEGKQTITEAKSTKTYRDGIVQGQKSTKAKVSTYFTKYLDYSVKLPSNKIKEKKFAEFKQFLEGGNKGE